jgi:hypothetical protein
MDERRQHFRLAMPIEGSWHGASGANVCRIADVSIGGCFIQSLATPTPGEATNVTMHVGPDDTLTLRGLVVYVERGMGFAVSFQDVPAEAAAKIRKLIEERA